MIPKDVLKNKLKRNPKKFGVWNETWGAPVHPKSIEYEIAVTVRELERLKQKEVFLRSDTTTDILTETLWKRLQDFKDDVKEGIFAHKRLMR